MPEKWGDKFLRELALKVLEIERITREAEALINNEPETTQDWVEQERN